MSPYGGFTEGTVLADDPALGQPTNRMLQMLDPTLMLAFNTRLKRFEVWNKTFDEKGCFYGFIIRCQNRDGSFREPGGWLIDFLKGRDSAYAGAQEAAHNVLSEIKEAEQAALDADRKKDDDAVAEVAQEIALDYSLEAQLKSDPHITGKRHYEWDTEPIHFGQAGAREVTREDIRKEGQSK